MLILSLLEDDLSNPAIAALVKELQSEETRQFIIESYNGAVIPVKLEN